MRGSRTPSRHTAATTSFSPLLGSRAPTAMLIVGWFQWPGRSWKSTWRERELLADRAVGAKVHNMPEGLVGKRGVWNPQNSDSRCFQWCIRAHMADIASWGTNSRKKAAERLSDPRFFEDYGPVQPGRPSKDLQKQLSDFGLDFSALPTDRKFFQREMVRGPTVENAPIQILLLRMESHYALIYDFSLFCSNRSAELDGSRRLTSHVFACHRCGGSFKSNETLADQEKPCSRDPAKRFTPIRMPDVTKSTSFATKPPLVFYADLETWAEEAPNVQVQELSHGLQRNVASAAFLAVERGGFELGQEEKSFLTHAEVGEHQFAVVERFLGKSLALAKRYVEWTKRTNVMPRPTDLQWTRHQAALRCERCNIRFQDGNPKRLKVCHHRHGTGEYLEALCATCNKGIRQPPCVPTQTPGRI